MLSACFTYPFLQNNAETHPCAVDTAIQQCYVRTYQVQINCRLEKIRRYKILVRTGIQQHQTTAAACLMMGISPACDHIDISVTITR